MIIKDSMSVLNSSHTQAVRDACIHSPEVSRNRLLFFSLIDASQVTSTAAAKSLQSCPTLGHPIDGSPPGSPIPGIFQARTLEWVAISFSTA